jgi:hypothetical protein
MVSKARRILTEALRTCGAGFSVCRRLGRRRRYVLAAAAAGLSLLLFLDVASHAREPLDVPFRRIGREHRKEARSIMEDANLVRRLPGRAFRADSAVYVYLLDNLPLSSRLADALDFGSYRVEQMEDGRLRGYDFSGVEGDFWLIHSRPGVRIYRGTGSYDSWFTPKISGRVLMVVEFRKIPAADPESEPGVIQTTLDAYVSTNRLVGFLMEFMGQVTDKKLSQLVGVAQLTSEKLSSDPQGVWEKMNSSGLFTPEELEDFRKTVLSGAGDRDPTSRP